MRGFWSARDDSGVGAEEDGGWRRGRLRAGVRPPGGAAVDGFVMKKQAGVCFRVRVLVADWCQSAGDNIL